MRFFTNLLFILFLSSLSLNASDKEIQNIANISAVSLYNIDKNSLQRTIDGYIRSNPNLKALKITETLSGEVYYQMYKENGNIFMNKKFPKFIKDYKLFTSKITYENETVGEVVAYFEKHKATNKISLSEEEINWISKNPNVKVIQFFDEPPFTLNSKSKKQGYLYELIEYLLDSVNLKVKYINGITSYDAMLQTLEAGNADILTTFPNSLDLEKKSSIKISKSVLTTPFVLIGKSHKKDILSIFDVPNTKIAVVKGYAQDYYLDKFPNIKKVYVQNNKEGFDTLRANKADYYINNRANSEYVLTKSFATDLKILGELSYKNFPPLSISFAMNGQKKHLVSILNKALQQMPYEKIKKLQDKWIRVKQNTDKPLFSEKEKEWLQKNPMIKIAIMSYWKADKDGNNIHTELIKLLNKYGNLNIIPIKYNTWKNGFSDASKGKNVHGILNLAWSKEREKKYFQYIQGYDYIPHYLITYKDDSSINNLTDLINKSVYVKQKNISKTRLQNISSKIKIKELSTNLEILKNLSLKKASAAIVSNIQPEVLEKYNLKIVKTIYDKYNQSNLGINHQYKELGSLLKKVFAKIPKSEIAKIQNKNYNKKTNSIIQLTKKELKWIKNNTVKVGVEEWAPVIFSHSGSNFDGITGDILRLIVQKTGLRLEVKNDTWDVLLRKFKNKELDLLPATYYTDERATYGLYSDSYYKMLDYIYVKENNEDIKSLNDLKGKTLAIVKDYGTIPKIREKFPEINIVETRDQGDSIQRVLRGEVDALYDGQIAVQYRMQEDLIVGLKGILQKSFKATPLHMFSHIDKPILRDILNKALKSIPPHEITKIKTKWLIEKRDNKILQNIKNNQKPEDTVWLLMSAIGLFLGLLFILIIITRFISDDFVAKSFGSSRFKIIALLILSVVILMLAMLVQKTLVESKKNILSTTKSDLEFVLNSTQDRVDTWISEREKFLLQMGRDDELVKATKKLLAVNKDANTLKSSSELEVVRQYFRKRAKEFGNLGFFIIDKDLISVGSMRDSNLGTKNLIAKHTPKLLEKVFKGEAVFIPPMESDVAIKNSKHEHTMFFAVPIQDKDDNVIAVLTQRLDVEGKFSEIIQSGRIGKSGESYLFSKDGFMLTKSRFRSELISIGLLKNNEKEYGNLQLRNPGGNLLEGYTLSTSINKLPLTKMVQNAISLDDKTTGDFSKVYADIEGYKDYRGVSVYGAWIWYNKYHVGLTTEIDESEALRDFYILRQNLVIITGLTLLLTVMSIIMLIILGEKATRSIQKANEELSQLIASFDKNVIASKTNISGKITYVSDAFCDISGYTREELLGNSHRMVRHSDMPKDIFKELWKTISNGKPWRGEIKNRKKNGDFYWVDIIIEPEFDKERNITGYSAIRQDITAKKEVEELSASLEQKVEERTLDLKKSQKQFSSIVSNVPGVIYRCLLDENWTMIFISDEIVTLSGYPVSDYINNEIRTFADIMHPDDKEPTAKEIIERINNKEQYHVEYRIIHKNGDVKWVSAKGKVIDSEDGKIDLLDGVIFDITEQKKLEEQIKESEKRFATIFDSAPDSISLIKDGRYISCNQKTLDIFGVKNEKLFKQTSPADYSPEFQENGETSESLVSKKIQKVIDEGYSRFEWIHKRLDTNESFDAEVILSSITLSGEPHIYTVVRDITERKKAQKEIADQKQYIDTIMNSQSNIVISTDGKQIRTANKAFMDFYGIKELQEFLDDFGDCICDTFDTKQPNKYIQKIMGEEKWVDYVCARPDQLHKVKIIKDDIEYIFTITAEQFEFDGEALEVAVFTDITELEIIREEVEKVHKHTRDSIEYASLIQHALIPDEKLFEKYFDNHFSLWQPKDIVGGDIYLFEELRDENECLLFVIDCTGHGVPGAFVTMLVKAIERQVTSNIINSNETVSPAKILSIFNKSMKHLLKQEDETSISNAGFDGGILYYNKEENIIKFSGAETALFYTDEHNQLQTIKGSRHSIGYKKSDANYEFKEHIIEAKEGMQFYLTTDGFLDQNGGEKGFPFGKKRFKELLETNQELPMNEQKEILLETLHSYQNEEERNDDIAVVGVKISNSNTLHVKTKE